MTIRFYFDEDCMRHSLITALRARNVDVITAHDADMIEREDSEHLDYATQHSRVIYSSNIGDFYRLHTEYLTAGKSHFGILLAPQQRYSIGSQMRGILKLMAAKSEEGMQNQLEFIGRWI